MSFIDLFAFLQISFFISVNIYLISINEEYFYGFSLL